MHNFVRSTNECLPSQLKPELYTAIIRHAGDNHLGNIEDDALICIEVTDKCKSSRDLFNLLHGEKGVDENYYTAAVITPKWLIWAVTDATTEVTVFSLPLSTMWLGRYEVNAPAIPLQNKQLLGANAGSGAHESLGFLPASESFNRILQGVIERSAFVSSKR